MTMTDYARYSLQRHPSVTIEAAAELTNLDIPTLREWARLGDLVIEQRGDMEVVQLEVVTALASRHRASKRGALHDRLKEAEGTARTSEVVDRRRSSELARERNARGPRRSVERRATIRRSFAIQQERETGPLHVIGSGADRPICQGNFKVEHQGQRAPPRCPSRPLRRCPSRRGIPRQVPRQELDHGLADALQVAPTSATPERRRLTVLMIPSRMCSVPM